MTSVITYGAQLLPFVAPVAGVLVWWRLPRGARARFGVLGVVAGVLAAGLVLLTGLLHDDPRPFVVDPTSPPLFPHAADNGFPSDHTTYAATAALVVVTTRRQLGWMLLGAAVLGGLARVAARVHHLQDIAAALVIAAVSVIAGTVLVTAVDRRRGRDLGGGSPQQVGERTP